MSDGEKQEVLRLTAAINAQITPQISQRHQTTGATITLLNLILRILLSYLIRGSDHGSAYYYRAARPGVFPFVMGYWRLIDWNMSARQLVSFIEEHLDLGVTTVDHADIYGGYQCEAAFGEALNWHLTCVNGWKSSVNAVSRRPRVKKTSLVIHH